MVNGFSSINPALARGPQVDAGTYTKIYGGRRSSRKSSPSQPTVSISGDTVTIGGQGYSVAPSLQAQFLASRGVSVSSSIQQQIQSNVQKQEAQARQAEARRQAEQQARIQAGTQAQQNIQLSAQQVAELQRVARQSKGYDYGQGTRIIEPPRPIGIKPTKEKPIATVDIYKSKDPYKQSYKESLKQVGSRVKENVKTFLSKKEQDYTDILTPLEYSGKLKKEKVAQPSVTYYNPRFGTVMTDPLTGKSLGGFEKVTTEQKTYGQVQAGIESKRQAEINKIGEVSPEVFQQQATDIYKKYPDVPNLYERTGSKIKGYVPLVADIAITTGLSVAGSPLAGGAYLTYRGLQKASQGQYKDIRSGTQLYSGIKELSPESKQAGLYLLSGVPSFIGATGQIAREIDVLRLKEGVASKSGTIGKFYDIKTQDLELQKWIQTTTRQKTPYYQSQTKIDARVISKAGGDFSIAQGRGTQTVRFLPFSEQIGDSGWKIVQTEFATAGRGTTRRAILEGVNLPKRFSATLGEGYVTPIKIRREVEVIGRLKADLVGLRGGVDDITIPFGKKYTFTQMKEFPASRISKDFGFGGLTEDVGKGYYGKGGRITTQRIYPEVSGNVKFTDDLIEIPLRTTAKIPIKDTSFIFKKTPTIEDDFGLVVKKVFDRKSSQSFIQSLSQPTQDLGSFSSRASSVVTETTKNILKPTKKITPMFPLASAKPQSSVYAGTGLYERTEDLGVITKPQVIGITKQSLGVNLTPVVSTASISLLIPKVKQISRSSTRQRSILDQKALQDTMPKQMQETRQTLRLGQQTKQTQRLVQQPRLNFRTGFSITPTFGVGLGIPPIALGLDFPKPKQGIKKVETYSVFIKRRGKFQAIGGDLSYGKALKLGELETKQTLGRTFKVRKTGFKEVGIDESFSEPDLGIFRQYKVRGGKKLDLPTGTFIQRTPFSLSSAGEKREIQMARQQARELNNLINM